MKRVLASALLSLSLAGPVFAAGPYGLGGPPAPPPPGFPPPAVPPAVPPGPQGEEVALPVPPPTHYDRHNPFYYMYHTLQHGVVRRHHGRFWQYTDGEHHGWPYGCTTYEPRAAGASYTFGQWVPRRSYYYAYQWDPNAPYGFSPEPYYHTPR